MRTEEFEFNGYKATVIIPKNPNGKWIWKTEFLYSFDKAEVALCEKGYTRVYYQISDKYGSYNAVRLMHMFHLFIVKKYNLEEKANLFGFSRGGLYAFNYALFYPEYVNKVYLDAPVLNLKSWPPKDSIDQKIFFAEYNLNKNTFESFQDSPIDHLEEFQKNNIPLLIVAGDSDYVVPFSENGQILVEYYKKCGTQVELYLKENCGHHPHSLQDVQPIVQFVLTARIK